MKDGELADLTPAGMMGCIGGDEAKAASGRRGRPGEGFSIAGRTPNSAEKEQSFPWFPLLLFFFPTDCGNPNKI